VEEFTFLGTDLTNQCFVQEEKLGANWSHGILVVI